MKTSFKTGYRDGYEIYLCWGGTQRFLRVILKSPIYSGSSLVDRALSPVVIVDNPVISYIEPETTEMCKAASQ